MRRERRAPLAWAVRVGCCWLLAPFSGCVSTELEPAAEGLPCLASGAAAAAQDSLVNVSVKDGDVYVICSGVAIAPTLVLTAASCLFQSFGPRRTPDPAQICDSSSGWAPVERGDFSDRIGRAYDLSALSVSRTGTGNLPLRVREVQTSGTTSRCEDDLALVIVDRPIGAPAAVVRLEETSQVGEQVTLTALRSLGGALQTNDAASSVLQVTSEAGEPGAPPRSLLLVDQVCSFERGGGVFSFESNALIGIIAWGSGSCADPEGTTVAVRLAPFRRFLAQTAANEGEALHAEQGPHAAAELRPCAAD